MHVAFVSGSSDAAGAAILLKVVRYFSAAPRAIERLCAILELSGTTKTVCSVIEYYVCQFCARNNVLVNGYPVFAQYKVMISFYSKRHFSARWDDGGRGGGTMVLPLRGAHFLYWFIVHDLDQEFVANFELFKTSMSVHRREMARTYRRRQQAKQLQPSSPSAPPPLGRTAARTDRLRPPVITTTTTTTTKRRRRSYAATAQRDDASPPSWLAAAAVAAAAAAAAVATGGGTASDSGDDDGGGGILGGGGVATAQV